MNFEMFDIGNQRSVLGLSNEVWKVFCILTIQRVIADFQICVEKKLSFFARDCTLTSLINVAPEINVALDNLSRINKDNPFNRR